MLNRNPAWVDRPEGVPEEEETVMRNPVGFQVHQQQKNLDPEAVKRMADQMLSEGSTGEYETMTDKPELNPMQKKLRYLAKMKQTPTTQKMAGGNNGTGIY